MVKDSIFAKIGKERHKAFSITCIDKDLNKSKVLSDAIDDFLEKKGSPDWVKKEVSKQ